MTTYCCVPGCNNEALWNGVCEQHADEWANEQADALIDEDAIYFTVDRSGASSCSTGKELLAKLENDKGGLIYTRCNAEDCEIGGKDKEIPF